MYASTRGFFGMIQLLTESIRHWPNLFLPIACAIRLGYSHGAVRRLCYALVRSTGHRPVATLLRRTRLFGRAKAIPLPHKEAMNITKNLGMLLLAIYLILAGI